MVRCALKDTEERERKVVALQESLIRRRKDLERQHVVKLQETDGAITRLQVILFSFDTWPTECCTGRF